MCKCPCNCISCTRRSCWSKQNWKFNARHPALLSGLSRDFSINCPTRTTSSSNRPTRRRAGIHGLLPATPGAACTVFVGRRFRAVEGAWGWGPSPGSLRWRPGPGGDRVVSAARPANHAPVSPGCLTSDGEGANRSAGRHATRERLLVPARGRSNPSPLRRARRRCARNDATNAPPPPTPACRRRYRASLRPGHPTTLWDGCSQRLPPHVRFRP